MVGRRRVVLLVFLAKESFLAFVLVVVVRSCDGNSVLFFLFGVGEVNCVEINFRQNYRDNGVGQLLALELKIETLQLIK